MNKIVKRGLLIALIFLVAFLTIILLSINYHDVYRNPTVNFSLVVLPLALLALLISLIFAYTTMCLNDKMLWFGILGLYLLSLFWIFLRITKIIIITDNYTFMRMIWYLYYLPMLFAPYLLITLTIYVFTKNKKLFCIIASILFVINLILLLLVLTNDATQLVFVFDKTKPEANWSSNKNYERTWLYYVVAGLILLEVIVSGFLIGFITRKKRMLLAGILYIICALIGLGYAIMYLLVDSPPTYLKDMTSVYLLLGSIIIFVSVKYGLFISSGSYVTFFSKCAFPLRVESKNNYHLENDSYLHMDKDKQYRSQSKNINNAKFTVYEDISKINEYNATLTTQLSLIRENNLTLEKRKEILKEQELSLAREELNKHLEDAIEEDIKKLTTLSNELGPKLDKRDEKQKKTLDEIYHLCNYIKRKSYLVLMEENSSIFTKESLQVFIKELLAEFTPKLQDYEVVVNHLDEIPIIYVFHFVEFIYKLLQELHNDYRLFLIFTKKDAHYVLRINVIDYPHDLRNINITVPGIVYHIDIEDNVTIFVLEDKENV